MQRTPHAMAVTAEGGTLSYAALNTAPTPWRITCGRRGWGRMNGWRCVPNAAARWWSPCWGS
ncbi:MAG: hypothetical protein N6V49_00840 [Serratia symbiotica]|nr:hypothetical protein [Serratia symbiotica]